MMNKHSEKGSVELIVIGLLAALIIILAVPFITDIGTQTASSLSSVNGTI